MFVVGTLMLASCMAVHVAVTLPWITSYWSWISLQEASKCLAFRSPVPCRNPVCNHQVSLVQCNNAHNYKGSCTVHAVNTNLLFQGGICEGIVLWISHTQVSAIHIKWWMVKVVLSKTSIDSFCIYEIFSAVYPSQLSHMTTAVPMKACLLVRRTLTLMFLNLQHRTPVRFICHHRFNILYPKWCPFSCGIKQCNHCQSFLRHYIKVLSH